MFWRTLQWAKAVRCYVWFQSIYSFAVSFVIKSISNMCIYSVNSVYLALNARRKLVARVRTSLFLWLKKMVRFEREATLHSNCQRAQWHSISFYVNMFVILCYFVIYYITLYCIALQYVCMYIILHYITSDHISYYILCMCVYV